MSGNMSVSSEGISNGLSNRTSMPKTPPNSGTEGLTPMPDYMKPVCKSASHRYRKLHEDLMMSKLLDRRKVKKQHNQEMRDQVRKQARKIPIEILTKSWLTEDATTVETRAFLVDKVFPTVILGMEKLLLEAEKKELANSNEVDSTFNPVNFLAQYLMRNNPKYSNFSEASPYVRGLRQVGEELREQLFDIEENKLARIKAEARKKKEEREKVERLRIMEVDRRYSALVEQFKDWHIGRLHEAKVDLALLQNTIRSFAEIAEQYPEDLQKSIQEALTIEATDDTGKKLKLKGYVQYMEQFTEKMPSEIFDAFTLHMSRCARTYRSQSQRDQRKVILTQLFKSCDHTGVGLIDRHRVLNLFEMFFDKALNYIKSTLRDPRKWPVIEVHEMVDSALDSDEEGDAPTGQAPCLIDNNVEMSETPVLVSDGQQTAEEVEKIEEVEGQGTTEEEITREEKGDEPEKKTDEENSTEGTAEVETKPKEEEEAKPNTHESSHQEEKVVEEEKEEKEEKKEEEEAEEAASNDDVELHDKGIGGDAPGNDEDPEFRLSLLSEGNVSGGAAPMTQQSKVSFAEGTNFQKEQTLLTAQGTRSHSQASAFDENTLNLWQFMSLIETFLGDIVDLDAFTQLVRFIREGYMETEEERMERLMKARQEAMTAKRKALLNSLFEMWDNDGSGYLEMEEIESIMKKYKEGMDKTVITEAKKGMKKKSRYHDNRLTKREFRDFVYAVVDLMPGGREESFEYFIEYMLQSVERSYAERVRGEARKKWLQQIITSAETSGGRMEPIYKSVFQALYKDAEAHGGAKVISANISLMERNLGSAARGSTCLRYVATTSDDAEFMLNKVLYSDMKGVSFAAVESGKPLHVPRVMNHGNIHFWNPEREVEEKDGSFIVIPLKDRRKHVFGLLGVDTLRDPHGRAIFITHEIQFFQGVAKGFSIAYHHVDIRQKTMRISESAVSWIQRRCMHVHEISVYLMEPHHKAQDYVLRKMIVTDHKANAVIIPVPPRLERKDNLFRDYLFKCVDNSESVTADAYGERHLAFPLRDEQGRAIVVIDVSIGGELKALPKAETKEIMKMLKLLQQAYDEITKESHEGEKSEPVLEGEKKDEENRTEILFDRLMLMELRENVSRLDVKSYAELKSYKEPPKVIHFILKGVLTIFWPEKAIAGELDDWNKCKNYVNPTLSQKIMDFDPTANDDGSVPLDLIHEYFEDVPHGQVSKFGSIPAQHLYNWAFVCVSMIEHSRKMKESGPKEPEEETAPNAQAKEAENKPATEEQPQKETAEATQAAQENAPRTRPPSESVNEEQLKVSGDT